MRVDTFIHWPLTALIMLAVLGYSHFVDHPGKSPILRKHRLVWIDFLLYLAMAAIGLCYIVVFFRPTSELRSSILLGGAAIATAGLAFGLIIWQDIAITEPRRVVFNRPVSSKLMLTLAVLGLPAAIFTHVAVVEPELYSKNLSIYRDVYSVPLPTYVEEEDNPTIRGIYEALPALHLHYLRTGPFPALSEDVAGGREVAQLSSSLRRWSESAVLTGYRLLFFFLGIYLVVRYMGLRIEVLQGQEEREQETLGLEEDVISKVSTFLAVLLGLVGALILSGFSFGEIGLFGGLVAAGVSVALRDVLANLMAGVILTWDRTISKDDVISLPAGTSSDVTSTYGIVKAMTLRYTVVEERNTVARLIPNSLLINSTVENWTKSGDLVRLAVNVGVDYGADPKKVKDILESVCYEVERVAMDRRPQALITAFNDSAVNFSLRFWAKEPKKGIRPILSAVYFHILERFSDEGITISYPQLDLHLKSIPAESEVPVEEKGKKVRGVVRKGRKQRSVVKSVIERVKPTTRTT